MIKPIIAMLLLSIAAPSMAKVLTTKDNLLSVTVSSDRVYVRTPAENDVLTCLLRKTMESPKWESGEPGKAMFYACSNGAVLSFKNYTSRSHNDMVFIFEGDKLMYSDDLDGKVQ